MIILKHKLVIALLEILHLFPRVFRSVKAFKYSISFTIFNDLDSLGLSFPFQPHLPFVNIFPTRMLWPINCLYFSEVVMLLSGPGINWCINSLRPLSETEILLILSFTLGVSFDIIGISLLVYCLKKNVISLVRIHKSISIM